MDDLISRQVAIDDIETVNPSMPLSVNWVKNWVKTLPSAQPEQSEMIKDIRKWINSGNRGNADYFIVDKIEEIINKYER